MIVLVMNCVYMIKMIASMQFLLSLEIFENYGVEHEHDQVIMNQEHHEFEFVYVIVLFLV